MELKESRRLAAIAVKALEDKLATDISVIEIDQISPLGDYVVIGRRGRGGRYKSRLRA